MEKCDFQWEALRKTTIPLYRGGDFLKREAAWTVCRSKDWGGGVDKKEVGEGGGVFEGRFDTAIHTMILERLVL